VAVARRHAADADAARTRRQGRGDRRDRAGGLLVAGIFFGVDITPFLDAGLGGGGAVQTSAPRGPNRIDDDRERFVAVVLADTEEIWDDLFRRHFDRTYRPPQLVLFGGVTRSACGQATSATGPFYCPGDRKAYLDTEFFETLERRLGAKGDFAQAYVIAHEVAHHVQNELGILPEVNKMRARAGWVEANDLSVRIELQADCFSGVWAHQAEARFGSLEPGDIEEALNAASQIGDDTLQKRAGQAVAPDSFQHGSSAQRVRWFRTGFEAGDPTKCDTFNAARL
jgi:predicted metalloprotease